MRTLLIISLFVSVTDLSAQWEFITGGEIGPIWDIEYVPSEGRLYAVGQMTYIGDSIRVRGTAYYESGQWYPMGDGVTDQWLLNIPVRDVLDLDTAIMISGEFNSVDSVPNTQEFAYWQNDEWHSMGVSNSWLGSARRSVVVDDLIHVLGNVDTVNGQAMYNWAVFDGTGWSAGDTSDPFTQGYTQTLIRYQGDLIMGGNFIAPNGDVDLVRQGPNGWEKLGQGILGDPWVHEMVEYEGLLWVVGEFYDFWGNPGTGLMVWDGSQWWDPFPQLNRSSQGFHLNVVDDVLYMVLPFQVNGLSGTYGIAKYDGQQLCVIGGPSLAINVTASADTLYALRPGLERLWKWPLNAPADTCFQVSVGIAQHSQSKSSSLLLAPNPATTDLTISLGNGLMQEVAIRNVQGQLVKKVEVNSNAHKINLDGVVSGLYFVSVLTDAGIVVSERLVIE